MLINRSMSNFRTKLLKIDHLWPPEVGSRWHKTEESPLKTNARVPYYESIIEGINVKLAWRNRIIKAQKIGSLEGVIPLAFEIILYLLFQETISTHAGLSIAMGKRLELDENLKWLWLFIFFLYNNSKISNKDEKSDDECKIVM